MTGMFCEPASVPVTSSTEDELDLLVTSSTEDELDLLVGVHGHTAAEHEGGGAEGAFTADKCKCDGTGLPGGNFKNSTALQRASPCSADASLLKTFRFIKTTGTSRAGGTSVETDVCPKPAADTIYQTLC
jgi:hypothetical protein